MEVGIYIYEFIVDICSGKKIFLLDMLKVIEEIVEKLFSDGKFVIVIGGEYSIINGIVKVYKKLYLDEVFIVI